MSTTSVERKPLRAFRPCLLLTFRPKREREREKKRKRRKKKEKKRRREERRRL